MALRKFIIERDIPKVGTLERAIIHKHAEVSGFPATKVTEVKKMIDPTTAGA
jgi:hypothetical protein